MPILTAVVAQFDTTTNDKDHDTYLDVTVFNHRGLLLAEKTGIGGHWNDHSSNTVTLDIKNNIDKSLGTGGGSSFDDSPERQRQVGVQLQCELGLVG